MDNLNVCSYMSCVSQMDKGKERCRLLFILKQMNVIFSSLLHTPNQKKKKRIIMSSIGDEAALPPLCFSQGT